MMFEFNSVVEFKERLENKDLALSTEIFNQIKKAFYSKVFRKKVTAFTVIIKGDEIDFILERDQWHISLNTCMNTFADHDMFEECIEIQKMLKELK
jgi:hypothetical protein